MIERDHLIHLAMETSFAKAGIPTSWEFPGILSFTVDRQWATGLCGWHYATPWDGDGEAIGIADEEDDLNDMTPEAIATAWLAVLGQDHLKEAPWH